ncbi:MAG: zf-HC2 domain-containing protein [Candidatus Marinimicrobia bacterium]|nr:zf-HC2 domain-containing protein [Candidatus Neomarinimicrobiota bacterium]
MKICKDIKNQIPLYIDDTLDKEKSKHIKAHLEQCSECRKHYMQIKGVFGDIEHQNFTIENNYAENLLVEVNNRIHKKERVQLGFKLAASISAALLLVALLIFGLPDQQNPEFEFSNMDLDEKYYNAYLSLATTRNYGLAEHEYYLTNEEPDIDFDNIAYSIIESRGANSFEDIVTLTGDLTNNDYTELVSNIK